MVTHYFEFDFIYKGKTIRATCYVYNLKGETKMPYKYPLYRVAINSHKEVPDVFIFHEINTDEKRFFAYPFAENMQLLGQSIGETLETFNYRDKKFKIWKKSYN
jgi:hypothetical protein